MILKKGTPGAGLPPPRGNIHVYHHNIQISSLKLLGQSNTNLKRGIYRKEGTNVCINNPGHKTQMAVMSIYGKKTIFCY